MSQQESEPINNRSTPTEIRDNEVPTIQQELQQQGNPRPVNPPEKKK
jgi:hypothetical protein